MTRVCSKCHRSLPDSEFHVRRRDPATGRPLTLRRECRACVSERKRLSTQAKRQSLNQVDHETDTMLPIGPFAEWLTSRANEVGGTAELAEILGVNHRAVYRWLHESSRIHIDTVDNILVTDGSSDLRDLYPWLYDDDRRPAA